MEAVFLKLVNMSIMASYLVIVVLVLRFLMKKAPKSIHCFLWALVALRLLCPVTPESSFSLVEPERTERAVDSVMDDYVGSYRVYWDITDEYQTALDAGIMPIHAESGGSYVVTATTTPANEPTFLSNILSNVWLIGFAAMILYALISYLAVQRRVRISIALDKTVQLCDQISTPFILGIVRPKIYLPSDLDPMTAGHVLSHEQAHLKRRDHLWKPLGFLLLSVYWFNPVLWLAYILLCRDIEQACDEKVVKSLNMDGRKAYSVALLKCSIPRHMIAACPLAFGEVDVKSRIASVLNYKKPAFWVIVVAVIACIAVAVCFLTDPKDEGSSAYEVTSDLLIYDSKTVDVTVWDEDGSHKVYLTRPQIEQLSEIIRNLEDQGFMKKKPKKHHLYAVLDCKDFDIELHWDGEYAYFTFDAASEALITGNRRSVNNAELNAFLADVMTLEYRMASGTYVPISLATIDEYEIKSLQLAQTYRYEVSDEAFTVRNLQTGQITSYDVDWNWQGYVEANEKVPVYEFRSLTRTFDILDPLSNDWTVKYQYISEDYHLFSQNDAVCLVIAERYPDSDFVDWHVQLLVADHPLLLPPESFSEFLARIDEINRANVYNRSGNCRPGFFDMTVKELETLRGILKAIPERAITPLGEIYIDPDQYTILIESYKNTDNSISSSCIIYYQSGNMILQWYNAYTDTSEYYQIGDALLKDFLESMMQPERINSYTIRIDVDRPTYAAYTHGDVTISLVKVGGWEYEIVPYVDDQTAFGVRCKPEWLDDWLFFGYLPGELDPESTSLHEVKIDAGWLRGWHYLFENPDEETVAWREWAEPWKMIYRYADSGTYYIYNEGGYDERLAEHDRGGFQFISDSFEFIPFAEEADIISRSRDSLQVYHYENPEVTFDPETYSYNVLWHRKDSDGYAVVNVSSVWTTLVTEVAGTESE